MAEPLKNMYNADTPFIGTLTTALKNAYPKFDSAIFLATVYDDQWEARELKARMRHITTALRAMLPDDYAAAITILREASRQLGEGFTFVTMIFPDFVEVYGQDAWGVSIPALEQFTQQSSAEFAVRPFILRDQERMMAQMRAWAAHDSHHVRRLASEGSRPRLPWAMALPAFKADPAPILPILDALKNDESDYVRRSVANNINDIAKDNPAVVIEVLRDWQTHNTPEIAWITNHALRTLVKAGNPDALALLGYSHNPDDDPTFAVENLTLTPPSIMMGDTLVFSFALASLIEQPQDIMVDYIVHHMRGNGRSTPKVFKLIKRTLMPGERITINKKHSFKPITTRRYYPGTHALEIQVNGVVYAQQTFEMVSDGS